MSAITTQPLYFNGKRILKELLDLVTEDFNHHKQLSVTNSTGTAEDLYESVGSLYDFDKRMFTRHTSAYTKLNSRLVGSYVDEVIRKVMTLAESQDVGVGRIRLMLLEPKTCYTYHTDPEEYRFHIPLETNPNCFFMVDKVIYQMEQVGRLYTFRTQRPHTAINASLTKRYHLVFDTY